jgi:cysteinyl-tRNA synthetase
MKQLIEQIDNKYIGDDGIYFDITKDDHYGVLVKLDRSHEHHRINNDEYDKDHIADFALWKKQSGDEPAWPLELDGQELTGRPGWHLECSAMSVKYLGQPFDIHTGGVDLKFPHHENEIAQSRAAGGGKLANYFMHGEHLLVDGHKMSKKLQNFYTLADIVDEGYSPMALRLLFLQAHYRSQLNFTRASLEASQNTLNRFYAWSDLQFQNLESNDLKVNYPLALQEIKQSLSNDLATPEALNWFNGAVNRIDHLGIDSESIRILAKSADVLLGLDLSKREDISDEQKSLIDSRRRAKYEKEFTESDKIRDELKKQGIEVRDTDNGQLWSRI